MPAEGTSGVTERANMHEGAGRRLCTKQVASTRQESFSFSSSSRIDQEGLARILKFLTYAENPSLSYEGPKKILKWWYQFNSLPL
jgi:hypothetical protein